jgi:hypothetical protein
MKNVNWYSYEMAFIKFVLSEARRLEVFSIHANRFCLKSDEDALKVAEVARYMRASPAAKVVINRMP